MRMKTFVGKVSTEALHMMDDQVNKWLEDHQVEPKMVSQCFGYGKHHEVSSEEPFLIISVWY